MLSWGDWMAYVSEHDLMIHLILLSRGVTVVMFFKSSCSTKLDSFTMFAELGTLMSVM